jgi:dTDP-glucose 4,6-dehydratase
MEFEYGDVRYAYDIERIISDIDCVIHLAAKINVDRSFEDARVFVDTNIIGTYNVIEACRKHKKRLIHASTSEVLGSLKSGYEAGMDESHPYSPDNPYGATKAAADMLVKGWINSYGMDAILVRSFNVSGVGQSFDKEGAFIPKVINKVYNNENPIIFGDGSQTRDYLWAGDLAKAYYLLSKIGVKGETYHVGSGIENSITEIAQKLIEISGNDLEIEYREGRTKEVKRLKCNADKIKALGWKPTKDIYEILAEMYRARVLKDLDDND